VREGVFADTGRPGDWIGSFVGPHDYGIVIRAIESFDRLARSSYAEVKRRAVLPDRVCLRQDDWTKTVLKLLLETLRKTPARQPSETNQLPAPV
jgi:hypothetical protein